mmetsp:Transcript_31654/g.49571  ORF Transcript_31654/g.49571 Transcript_31654/m.49571 type:complete len:104 (+) Transcript_31654:155-466(+)
MGCKVNTKKGQSGSYTQTVVGYWVVVERDEVRPWGVLKPANWRDTLETHQVLQKGECFREDAGMSCMLHDRMDQRCEQAIALQAFWQLTRAFWSLEEIVAAKM